MDIDSKGFFEKVRQRKDLPTTSQPPVGEFVALFEKLAADGYDAVISIHLSSGLSGTFQGAVTAGTLVNGITVYPFDSEITCMVQGFYVLEAAKMAERGVGPEEILARLEELKVSADAYLMVDDLAHLQRGGRLSSAQAFFGSLLQVKPLLHFANNVIVPFEKIRTRKKAMKRIGELLDKTVGTADCKYRAVIIHANREAEALEWKTELESQFPTVEFSISYFGAVIGTHLGEGAMGMGWMKKKMSWRVRRDIFFVIYASVNHLN